MKKMMQYLMLVLFSALVITGCAAILKEDTPAGVKELRLYGLIIDNACAAQHRNDINEFSKSYSKTQALNCTLGYAFYFASEIREFDQESNEKIAQYLKDHNSSLNVDIKCYAANNKLHLVEIILPQKNSK